MTYSLIWRLCFALHMLAILLIWVSASNCPMSRRSALLTACGALVPTVVTLAWLYPFPEMPDPLAPLLSGEGGPGEVMARVRVCLVVYGLAGPLYSIRCSTGARMRAWLTSLGDTVAWCFTPWPARSEVDVASASLQFRWQRAFLAENGSVVIGSGADCGVRIRGHGVKRHHAHAEVDMNGGGCRVSPCAVSSGNRPEVFVLVGAENLPVGRDGRVLNNGDTIILGRARLAFVARQAEVAPNRAAATG